jgi:hypothetical protein
MMSSPKPAKCLDRGFRLTNVDRYPIDFAVLQKCLRSESPAARLRLSITKEASTKPTTEISLTRSASIAITNEARSGSSRRHAMTADASMTITTSRFRHSR